MRLVYLFLLLFSGLNLLAADIGQGDKKQNKSAWMEELKKVPEANHVDRLWALRGFLLKDKQAEKIAIDIGEALNKRGGFSAMLEAHTEIRLKCQFLPDDKTVRSFPRELEKVWDGIGDWQG